MSKSLKSTSAKTAESKQQLTSKLRTSEQIGDTPFWLQKFDDKYFITCGKYRDSVIYKTRGEALERVATPDYQLITLLIMATFDLTK